jgi:hypothetical protein
MTRGIEPRTAQVGEASSGSIRVRLGHAPDVNGALPEQPSYVRDEQDPGHHYPYRSERQADGHAIGHPGPRQRESLEQTL